MTTRPKTKELPSKAQRSAAVIGGLALVLALITWIGLVLVGSMIGGSLIGFVTVGLAPVLIGYVMGVKWPPSKFRKG